MIYTKHTFKPEHIGRKVRWKGSDADCGSGTGVLAPISPFGNVSVFRDDGVGWGEFDNRWAIKSYELIDEFPMPLKEAYKQGLLKVGQKIRTRTEDGVSDSTDTITSVADDSIKIDYEGRGRVRIDYSYGWIVESIEEPKEEKKEETACEYNPRIMFGIDPVFPKYPSITIHSSIYQPTKPTLMSQLTTIWSNLTLSADEKLLRELNLHDSEGKPTSEYRALQDAIIAKEYEGKVLEEAKKIKAELDADKSKE